MKTPSRCKGCGGVSFSWDTSRKTNSAAPDGRLRMNEVEFVFVLGCNDCSETLAVVSADKIAQHLTEQQQER